MCKHEDCHPKNNDTINEIENIITDHIFGDGVDAKSAAKKITGKWGMGMHGNEIWHINEKEQPTSEVTEGDLEAEILFPLIERYPHQDFSEVITIIARAILAKIRKEER